MKSPRILFAGSLLIVAFLAGALGTVAANQQLEAVGGAVKNTSLTIPAKMHFRFTTIGIWSVLTLPAGVEALTGCTIDEADRQRGKELFKQLGDSAAATIGETKGRMVVTAFDRPNELRLVFEPAGDAPLRAWRFTLSTAGEGSQLYCVVRFPDEPAAGAEVGEGEVEAARKARAELLRTTSAFRTLVQETIRPGARGRGMTP